LGLNGVLRVADLPHSEKLKFLTSADATVAHVMAIREEAAPAAEEGAVATAEGAAASAATEPEVAKKGKTETEAAGKKPEAKK